MCDKKNNVLFTDTECVVLSLDFKLTDESHVLLKVPRKDNMYNVDLKNVAPQGGLTCLFAKVTPNESNLWHRRLGHVNFKTVNTLAMKMEHYLAHTDYPIWEVIQNGNGPVSITTDTQGQIKVLPPRTAEEILARERERKARTTLLMALPEDHLAKFHKITDAKEMWEAIRYRFGGNDESKKMQKYILKQQFKGVSTEDANQKFLRSLPSAWSQVSLIMRTKPGVNSLSFDDLYNNLRVFENDVKGSTASSSSTHYVAFVSENTSSTNNVSTTYGVSSPCGQNSQYEQTSSYSLLANQSSCPQLDHEDLE
ncbi:ribonuclease H-like domain-containing protein [Tanacetum coccineum]